MAAAPDLTTDSLFDRHRPIDVDTHITEPPDVWTSRVASKWGDKVPHVVNQEGRDLWMIGDQMLGGPGFTTAAGFDGSYPESREGFHDIPKSSWDAQARLEYMDDEGIYAAVLYPNVGGFGSGGFLKLDDEALQLECVRAYNDFLVDWCSVDTNRLIPVAAMPFWNVNEMVKEVHRAADIGHKSILACSAPQDFDQPRLADKHWEPFWSAVQETGLSVSFHIGAGDLSDLIQDPCQLGPKAAFSRTSSMVFMQNVQCIADLIFGGICHRFPDLNFVSVESGVGWIPSYLEAADWQWSNGQVVKDHPEYDLLPSEYFKRQIYGCFWFETGALQAAATAIGDNLMWETDYPHPTCMHPGPVNGLAQHPRDYVNETMGDMADSQVAKILHSNAARIYGVE